MRQTSRAAAGRFVQQRQFTIPHPLAHGNFSTPKETLTIGDAAPTIPLAAFLILTQVCRTFCIAEPNGRHVSTRSASPRPGDLPGDYCLGSSRWRADCRRRAHGADRRNDGRPAGRCDNLRRSAGRDCFRLARRPNCRAARGSNDRPGRPWWHDYRGLPERLDWRPRAASTTAAPATTRASARRIARCHTGQERVRHRPDWHVGKCLTAGGMPSLKSAFD